VSERIEREELTIEGGRRLYLYRFVKDAAEAGEAGGPQVSSPPADDAVAQPVEDDE
jgi:hypothetical protein